MVAIVTVEEPAPLSEEGLKVIVTPAGRAPWVNTIDPLKPDRAWAVRV